MESKIKNITSDLRSLNSFLLESKDTFLIPDFQRDFVWEKDDVKQLLEDFSDDTNQFSVETSELEGYLLGNIVLIDNGNEKIVIDGQQRLTTITLIFKVLEQIISQKIQQCNGDQTKLLFWGKKMGGLQSGYAILDDHDTFERLKISHDPGLPFGTYYRKLMNDALEQSSPETKSDLNILDVYEGITEYLEELSDNELIQFIAYFKNKVMLIVTNSPSHSKAFQLFEVLNDRGRSLEPMDLIKNLFLKTLNIEGFKEDKISTFNDNWKSFINNLQKDPKRKISSSTFLKHFILGTEGKNLKKEKLFDYYLDEKLTGTKILELSSELSYTSKIYSDIERKEYSSFYSDDNMYIVFDLLKIKQIHPLLIPFYKDKSIIKEKIIDLSARLSASVLFSFTQTNFIEKILPSIIKSYNEKGKGEEAFSELVNKLELTIEEKATESRHSLVIRKFENSNGRPLNKALDLLKFIELYFHNNPLVRSVPKGKKLSLEHILSKEIQVGNYSELGFSSEEEFRNNINKIGNLTLLYNTDNASINNSKFNNKVANYSTADFIITKSIVTNITTTIKNGKDTKKYAVINELEPTYIVGEGGHFSKDLIAKRTEDLSKLIYLVLTNKAD